MFVEENRRTRRIVARLVRGESIREGLQALARERAITTAWVSAHGVVARASLEARTPMRVDDARATQVEGPLELVSLTGDLASREGVMHLDASVVLAKHADHGIITLAGHLLDAEAEGVTVLIDCLDDLGLRREAEKPSGLEGWRAAQVVSVSGERGFSPRVESSRAPEPRVERAPVAKATLVNAPDRPQEPAALLGPWGAVAAASRAPNAATSLEAAIQMVDPIDDAAERGSTEDYMPVAGDWVDHRQFGLCRVDRALPDGELLIKLETGRRKEIRLDFLEVLAPRMDGQRKIFPLRPRKR